VLHLRKVVVNDNGGTATVADFALTADGSGQNDLSGTSPVDSGAGLSADTWALSETSLPGYAASAWSCDGGNQDGSSITVGIGQEATCTITNDDVAPVLHLRKVVVNDNGGTATVADFTLTADGAGENDLSGTSPVDSGAGLLADTWALSETSLPGYTASAWVCDGGSQDGSSITVGIGGEATCTITNDDMPPALSITKVADAAKVTAPGSIGFTVGVANGNADGVGVARAVTLADPLPAGAGVSWSISPAYSGPGTCSISGAVPHQTLTCSFGNMEAGASASVHITSATTSASAGTYENTATASASNEASVEASARTSVVVVTPVSVQGSTTTVPPTTTTVPVTPQALPFTGGNAAALAAVALVLMAAGAALTLSRRRRRAA
jgi:hypothetical protein